MKWNKVPDKVLNFSKIKVYVYYLQVIDMSPQHSIMFYYHGTPFRPRHTHNALHFFNVNDFPALSLGFSSKLAFFKMSAQLKPTYRNRNRF